MTDEQARIQAEAGHIAAEHEQRMGKKYSSKRTWNLPKPNSPGCALLASRIQMETEFANRDYEIKKAAIEREMDNLTSPGRTISTNSGRFKTAKRN